MAHTQEEAPERDDFSSNRHPALSFCWRVISGQTPRVCPEGKPEPTPHQVRGRLFPDHALVQPPIDLTFNIELPGLAMTTMQAEGRPANRHYFHRCAHVSNQCSGVRYPPPKPRLTHWKYACIGSMHVFVNLKGRTQGCIRFDKRAITKLNALI